MARRMIAPVDKDCLMTCSNEQIGNQNHINPSNSKVLLASSGAVTTSVVPVYSRLIAEAHVLRFVEDPFA